MLSRSRLKVKRVVKQVAVGDGGLRGQTQPLQRRVNSNWVRRVNAASILQALRDHSGASQRRIGEITGLDKATVSAVVGQLVAFGLIERTPAPLSGRQGRPEVALTIQRSAGTVVGVLLELERIDLIAADLAGRVVAKVNLPGTSDLDEARIRLAAGVEELVRRSDVGPILGFGVGIPALINDSGRLLLAPNLDWSDLPIGQLLGDDLPAPVWVHNDTKAAALAERRFGSCRSVDDFLYVAAHSGVGGALFLGGDLYRGVAGLAGEIGHINVVPNGERCSCGAAGCLEAYLSEPALRRQLATSGAEEGGMADIAKRAAASEPAVRDLLDHAGLHLAKALASLINTLNPGRVVLGGDLALIAPYLLPACLKELDGLALPAAQHGLIIEPSPLGRDAVAMGGIAMALDAAQERLLDQMIGLS
ncbi:MAG: ROK family transcriptional regulator [Pseudomonadota bacterium]